jgi:hypothetical protein
MRRYGNGAATGVPLPAFHLGLRSTPEDRPSPRSAGDNTSQKPPSRGQHAGHWRPDGRAWWSAAGSEGGFIINTEGYVPLFAIAAATHLLALVVMQLPSPEWRRSCRRIEPAPERNTGVAQKGVEMIMLRLNPTAPDRLLVNTPIHVVKPRWDPVRRRGGRA